MHLSRFALKTVQEGRQNCTCGCHQYYWASVCRVGWPFDDTHPALPGSPSLVLPEPRTGFTLLTGFMTFWLKCHVAPGKLGPCRWSNIWCWSSRLEVPNFWATDQYWSRPVRNQAAQQEVSLNHPETISLPRPVCGKTVCHETGPWYQKSMGTPGLKVTLRLKMR